MKGKWIKGIKNVAQKYSKFVSILSISAIILGFNNFLLHHVRSMPVLAFVPPTFQQRLPHSKNTWKRWLALGMVERTKFEWGKRVWKFWTHSSQKPSMGPPLNRCWQRQMVWFVVVSSNLRFGLELFCSSANKLSLGFLSKYRKLKFINKNE